MVICLALKRFQLESISELIGLLQRLSPLPLCDSSIVLQMKVLLIECLYRLNVGDVLGYKLTNF